LQYKIVPDVNAIDWEFFGILGALWYTGSSLVYWELLGILGARISIEDEIETALSWSVLKMTNIFSVL
jgi:hypothetical protein